MTCGDDDESSCTHTHTYTVSRTERPFVLIFSNVHYVHFGGDNNTVYECRNVTVHSIKNNEKHFVFFYYGL